jgi:hypothetical protein
MYVSQLGDLQLEKFVQGRPVLDALNKSSQPGLGRHGMGKRVQCHRGTTNHSGRTWLDYTREEQVCCCSMFKDHSKLEPRTMNRTMHQSTLLNPSVHSQMPLAQGAVCACTCAALARSKMAVVRSVEMGGQDIGKGVCRSRELWV